MLRLYERVMHAKFGGSVIECMTKGCRVMNKHGEDGLGVRIDMHSQGQVP